MDITNIPIVTRCAMVSQNIQDYFIEERYKLNFEEEEEITVQSISLIAITLVLDELAELGIVSALDESEIYYSELDIQTMLYLRIKLDKDNLFNSIKNLNEKQYSELKNMTEDCMLSEDLFLELTDYMTSVYPLDTIWAIIQRSVEYWGSDDKFAAHVNSILLKVEDIDNNKTYVDDSNMNTITEYLHKMTQRELKLKILTSYILNKFDHIDGVVSYSINNLVARYDKDKLQPDLLPLFATYKEVEGQPEPSYVKHHHEITKHHLEYWEKLYKDNKECDSTPTNSECAMIVVSFMLDELNTEQMLKEIDKFKPYTKADSILFMQNLARLDYNKILQGE